MKLPATAVGCGYDGDGDVSAELGSLTACPTTNVIQDPSQFVWAFHPASGSTQAYYSGTLEMGQATFTIGGQTLTTRAYRQAGTAYTIRARWAGSTWSAAFHPRRSPPARRTR